MKKKTENRPTQWEIGQPSDVSENPVKIKIPLGLLQRGVTFSKGYSWESHIHIVQDILQQYMVNKGEL